MTGALVARLRSSRHADVVYAVRVGEDGRLVCQCPGFAYRRSCRHVVALEALRALPLAPEEQETTR